MSEEESPEPVEEETPPANEPEPEKEEPKENNREFLVKRFRLTNDEEVLMTQKPSFFAFIELHILALLVIGIHVLVGQLHSMVDGDDVSVFLKILGFIMGGQIGQITGVVFLMLGLTWINRMLNTPGSGGWVTTYLLFVAISPILLGIDEVLAAFTEDGQGVMPFNIDYNATTFGIIFGVLMSAFTLFYQRSFMYAITNHRVIYTQHLFIPGDGRRILYENINEVRIQRTLLGTFLGYMTIITDTGNQMEMVEEGMSVSAGGASDKKKGIFGKIFAFVTYQRTRKIERPDPKICFYQVRNWRATETLLNEMHQKHSQSGALKDLQEKLENAMS